MLITHRNGTRLSVVVDAAKAFISDGAITPERAAQGGAVAYTALPAGELMLPTVPGSAQGQVAIDRYTCDGQEIAGLTLAIAQGRVTSMVAASGLASLRERLDAGGVGWDEFSCIDTGLNPELQLPVDAGMRV